MEGTLVFWLFLTFLIGAGMLALMLGYRSVEEQRACDEQRKAEELKAVRDMAEAPRFFVVQPASERPSTGPVLDEGLLADLETYVRSEQLLAARFVDEPSIDTLYQQAGSSQIVH